MSRNFKVLLFVLAVIVIAGSAYAFAAANTIPDNNVGSGVSTVSGYVISNIEYNFVPVTRPKLIPSNSTSTNQLALSRSSLTLLPLPATPTGTGRPA